MNRNAEILRKATVPVAALALIAILTVQGRHELSAAEASETDVGRYDFTEMAIDLPDGYPMKDVRQVNPRYEKIRAWISAVGAAVAMNDLDADGLANDLCVVDPRTDKVSVTPTPDSAAGRYQPFALDPDPLPMDDEMAPMGCVPGDYNEDGERDLLVYYWGRTPILFLARASGRPLNESSYRPVELVPGPESVGGEYHGPRWQSASATVADFDGDGHDDVFIGNYFPDSDVLDPDGKPNVVMNDSMSRALNGGENHIFRFEGGRSGDRPDADFGEMSGVFSEKVMRGWVLASAATDLDGDLLPELYIANDFGPDRMLHNTSDPGDISFELVEGERGPTDPKSTVVGHDSFKGMGIDFADLDGDGSLDMYVSNITTSFGVEESNLAFLNTTDTQEEMGNALDAGRAPFEEHAAALGLAWVGWGWDAKMADFDNNGELEIVQANGFVKGDTNRWPQLQELATMNDELVRDPRYWPRVQEDADLAGRQRTAFFARTESGRFTDLSEELGIDEPTPSRAIATGDSDGDGRLEFAIARQWSAPLFYSNDLGAGEAGASLGLTLVHPNGTPAIGTRVEATTAEGRTFVSHVDGGSGHGGKRSHEVHVGLGDVAGDDRVQVRLAWRDRQGDIHRSTLDMKPGRHRVELGETAREVPQR